jgi:hypothetical protein
MAQALSLAGMLQISYSVSMQGVGFGSKVKGELAKRKEIAKR